MTKHTSRERLKRAADNDSVSLGRSDEIDYVIFKGRDADLRYTEFIMFSSLPMDWMGYHGDYNEEVVVSSMPYKEYFDFIDAIIENILDFKGHDFDD